MLALEFKVPVANDILSSRSFGSQNRRRRAGCDRCGFQKATTRAGLGHDLKSISGRMGEEAWVASSDGWKTG
jgi:hypothetical protein